MELNKYAKDILTENGCDEYTYGDEPVETILEDLKWKYKDGMQYGYNYVEVANAIKMISKPNLIERKMYSAVWSTENTCDATYYDTFEEAKGDVMDTLMQFQAMEAAEWSDPKNLTQEDVEAWDYMIYNSYAYVCKYNAEDDSYVEYWYPSEEEEREIGWVESKELIPMLKEMYKE